MKDLAYCLSAVAVVMLVSVVIGLPLIVVRVVRGHRELLPSGVE